MRKKERASANEVEEQLEEPHLRAATSAKDPALAGVFFVLFELLTIRALDAEVAEKDVAVVAAERVRRSRRIEGLFRLAARDFPPELPLLAGLFGEHVGRLLVAAWPFVQGIGATYAEALAENLNEQDALFRILEAAGAVLVIGGGREGTELFNRLAKPAVKSFGPGTAGILFERIKKRALKPTQFRPKGHTRYLHAFIKTVAKNRMLDDPGSSTLRKYRARGIDTKDEEAVQAFREERDRNKRGLSLGYYSAREAAKALGVPDSTFRLAVKRAALRDIVIGSRQPPRGQVQYRPSDIKRLSETPGLLPKKKP